MTAPSSRAQTIPAARLSFSARLRLGLEANRDSIQGSFVIVAIFLAVLVGLSYLGIYDLGFIVAYMGTGVDALKLALVLTVASFLMGFAAAIPLGLIRAYAPGTLRRRKGKMADTLTYSRARELYGTGKAIRDVSVQKLRHALLAPAYGFATGYMEGIRGTPFFVQMWIVFYAVSVAAPRFRFLGQDVFFWIGLLALTINTIGYQSEVLRAGFQSVGQGQVDAAKAMGMKGRQVFAHITLPQSLRLVTLPLTNEWISLFKASSIVRYITINELFLWSSSTIAYGKGRPLEAFVMVAIFYLLVIIPLGRAINYIERKKRIPGLGTPIPTPSRRRSASVSRDLM